MTTPAPLPEAYTIYITSQEADLIGRALGKLPLEESLQLWMGLKSQVMQQMQAAADIGNMPVTETQPNVDTAVHGSSNG